MALTDEELFDFDKSRLADWDEKRAAEVLERMPDLYRNHLTIAKWIDGWRERLETDASLAGEFQTGYIQVLREVAAHLRQADFVPGGAILREFTGEAD